MELSPGTEEVSINGNITGGTTGSVLFVGPGSTIAQDNANFFWDDTNNRLGVGDNTPSYTLDVGGDVNATGKYRIAASQVLYIPTDQVNFLGSSFHGDGGQSLSHTTGNEGKFNTGVGIGALEFLTTGNNNTAIGYNALEDNSSGTFNVAVGGSALFQNTTGSNNMAIGDNALGSSLTNSATVGIGTQAGLNVTSDSGTFIGHQAGRAAGAYTAANVTAIGYQAAYGGSGNNGTAIGYRAGFALAGGTDNVLIGHQAGDNVTTGDKNIVIGANIDAPSATGNNQLNIGNIIFGTGVSGTGSTIAGLIGIGTTSPSDLLTLANNTAGGTQLGIDNANTAGRGDITFSEAGTIKGIFQYRGTTNGAFPNTFRFIGQTGTNTDIILGVNGSSNLFIAGGQNGLTAGNVGIGITTPTAVLNLKAGTATASTAPLKFTSGTLNTTAEAGAIEFLTDDYYATITTGGARKGIVLNDGTSLTSGRIPFATTNGRLTDDADLTFATDTLTATKIVGTTSVKVGTAAGYISSDGSTGATGTFTTADLKTVTVKDGIITNIS